MADADNRLSDRPTRLIHLHVPKTAGTALRKALLQAFAGTRRECPERYEKQFLDVDPSSYDFYSGHFGFQVANRIGGDIVTVLRDPVDRFLSVFYYLRNMYNTGEAVDPKNALIARYSLRDFVGITDEPLLIVEFENRMAWQIGHSIRLEQREAYRAAGHDEAALVRQAIRNLGEFAAVGLHTRMDLMASRIEARLGIALHIEVDNVTPERVPLSEIDKPIIRAIERWVHLDMALYAAAREIVGDR